MLVQDDFEPVDDYFEEADESVNLYELLNVPTGADTKQIRKRVSEMFLEAQNNVEHRNFRRRFYYRELVETVLPHARHHLLNVARREEYDRSLGLLPPLPPEPKFAAPAAVAAAPVIPITDFVFSSLPDAPAIEPLPPTPIEKALQENALPEIRLPSAAPTNAAPTNAAPASQPTTTTARMPQTESEDEVDFSKFAPVAATSHTATSSTGSVEGTAQTVAVQTPQRGGAPAHSRMDAELVERRRDARRRELIKQELQAAGTKWATIAGGGSFVGAGVLLFAVGWGLGFSFLQMLSVPMAAIVAALCGRYAHREARRRIVALLSQMPYDQLLHRCAGL